MLGPKGSNKCLVNGGNMLNITKDGVTVCKEVPFSQPTASVITNAGKNIYEQLGDGVTSFVIQTTDVFMESFKMYQDGAPIIKIVEGLQLAIRDVIQYIKDLTVPLDDILLRNIALSILKSKIKEPDHLLNIIMSSIKAVEIDKKMVEIVKMDGGDLNESKFIDGLVLDHSGRHLDMPKSLENVCILTTNISMEYEQPEISSAFTFSSIKERIEMAITENDYIAKRANKIAEIAKELKEEGKSLLVVSERGIDMNSLSILADAGVLALRRAKRSNMDRITKMCGGSIVTTYEGINREMLGYCNKVSVIEMDEEKCTFIEGVPFKTSCTILIRGSIDFKRIQVLMKGIITSLRQVIKDKICIRGGKTLYLNLITKLQSKLETIEDPSKILGYKILISVYENFIKTFLRNEGAVIYKEMAKLKVNGEDERIFENVRVVENVLSNSVYNAISLLMCDEMVVTGKQLKID
ncbi:TCPZ [Hepatospora eriocheir]|uniref:TCPZ n=1 Tax=Hepatospora eriocheir TaxID=1081669 RepID=A0A1X0QCH6_9MICR|nr:TCPZ [Hepatospora eriocheir]